MPEEMMNTREVADYLGIHEKQVYALIKSSRIPCTRVTGKWVFPKKLIDEWISSSAQEGGAVEMADAPVKTRLLASGSNDPVLDLLFSHTAGAARNFSIYSSSIGSTAGLRQLREGEVDIAFCHLFDPETGGYNIPFIRDFFRSSDIAVIHLFYRELGFLFRPGCGMEISSFKDVPDNVQFVNRQSGSGTRLLIDHFLDKNEAPGNPVAGYDTEVNTHFEVGILIKSGKADFGIATRAVAQIMDLEFRSLVSESFDMVLKKDTFFRKEVQVLIETLQSDEFRELVRPMGNYDFTDSGKIIFSID